MIGVLVMMKFKQTVSSNTLSLAFAISASLAVTGNADTAKAEEDDPSFLSFGAGYFDIIKNDDTSAEFRLEYRDKHRFFLFKPFAGVAATSDGSVHGYAGLLTDFYFGRRIVITPSAAAGPYFEGGGKDLGHVFEIRTGIEVAYRFDDRSRLSLGFYHISNAGIGDDENPGAEILSINYMYPLSW